MTIGIKDALAGELDKDWFEALSETNWEANELHAKHQAQIAMEDAAREAAIECGGG